MTPKCGATRGVPWTFISGPPSFPICDVHLDFSGRSAAVQGRRPPRPTPQRVDVSREIDYYAKQSTRMTRYHHLGGARRGQSWRLRRVWALNTMYSAVRNDPGDRHASRAGLWSVQRRQFMSSKRS